MVGCGSVTPAGLLKALEGTSSQEPRGSAASTGVASPDSGRGDLRPVVQAGGGSEAGVTDGHVSTETGEGGGRRSRVLGLEMGQAHPAKSWMAELGGGELKVTAGGSQERFRSRAEGHAEKGPTCHRGFGETPTTTDGAQPNITEWEVCPQLRPLGEGQATPQGSRDQAAPSGCGARGSFRAVGTCPGMCGFF